MQVEKPNYVEMEGDKLVLNTQSLVEQIKAKEPSREKQTALLSKIVDRFTELRARTLDNPHYKDISDKASMINDQIENLLNGSQENLDASPSVQKATQGLDKPQVAKGENSDKKYSSVSGLAQDVVKKGEQGMQSRYDEAMRMLNGGKQ